MLEWLQILKKNPHKNGSVVFKADIFKALTAEERAFWAAGSQIALGLYLQNLESDRDYRVYGVLTFCNCTLGKNVGSYIICANPPQRWTHPSPQQIGQWVKSVWVPPWYQPLGLRMPSLRSLNLYTLQRTPQEGLKASTEKLVHVKITTAGITNNPLEE